MSGLPPIDNDRRQELRRIDDAVASAARAYAAEALSLALRNRRTMVIIFLLAGVLYSVGFYLTFRQNDKIRSIAATACHRQQTNTDALRALSKLLVAAGVGNAGDPSVVGARIDLRYQVARLRRQGGPAYRAARDILILADRSGGRRVDAKTLVDAALTFRQIAQNADNPTRCSS